MLSNDTTLEERINLVEQRLQAACEASGRPREEIQLIAVSKKHPAEAVRAAVNLGLTVFGENKVQEAAQKIPDCPGQLEWHLIGHLQSNKVKYAVPLFDYIHSVDTLKLLHSIERTAQEQGKVMKLFIQVNIAAEAGKFGIKPDELPEVLEASSTMNNIEVVGLMLLPPISVDPEVTRGYFKELADLAKKYAGVYGWDLSELSMGMSGDFELAVQEGATHIRIGTDIFGKRTV